MEGVIAVSIPIIITLTVGLVILSSIYFRSREKQMLIEKGLSSEEIKSFFETRAKQNPYILMKIGIIMVFFGIGLGLGMILEDWTTKEYWIPLFLFVFTGVGFIAANLAKMEKSPA